jgi:hypothetical protein
VKPKNTEVSVICKRVLDQTHTLKILRIQPINICMRVVCIAGTPVDITTIHTPQIRDDVYVMLRNITRKIPIENARVKD